MSLLLFYTLSWFGLMAIAILNGMFRVMTYGRFMPEIRGHQLSTLTGIALTGFFVWKFNLYYPITSIRESWLIGLIWLVMTILFEFGFGHYVMHRSWEFLLRDYRLDKGRIWSIFLIWILLAPYIIHHYF
ncbi:MAG: hypothetical protein K9G76_10920 [Bacteroidales bacterium]|nr:hypothetical protein [Bacteroidales bacterium]MCF8404904.1 hypothetical protein [Bacteroidales bacterium]